MERTRILRWGEGKATEAEMKIQVNVHATEVFIFIRDSRYSPEIERSENAIYLSKDQAKEFAEDLLQRLSFDRSGGSVFCIKRGATKVA